MDCYFLLYRGTRNLCWGLLLKYCVGSNCNNGRHQCHSYQQSLCSVLLGQCSQAPDTHVLIRMARAQHALWEVWRVDGIWKVLQHNECVASEVVMIVTQQRHSQVTLHKCSAVAAMPCFDSCSHFT